MMIIEGTFKGGVVVLDDGCKLPDGTRVQVVVGDEPKPTLRDVLMKYAGCAQGLPEDMAAQHDHYLHGTPKR